jgi:Asp-tRNA(Asn)/Glu-tRNA(Gln) amidotransferase A subunit family amidase
MAGRLDRRDFVKLALTTAAGAGLAPVVLGGQGASTTAPAPAAAPPQAPPPVLPALGQGEHPALVFQAYPGGTSAVLEKLRKERGAAAFDRVAMTVEPWTGRVPATEEEVAFLPAHRLAALVQARRVTSVELTNIYLERLKRLDPVLLCAVTIMEGPAREAAQQADAEIRAGRYRGPLHGLPWGVKDLFSTRGVRTTWGTSDFENRIIDDDAEIVVRLREAGAVLIAKLATGRFASGDQWYRGRTNNPWQERTASWGGSSGSSAGPGSATAAGCVAFAIGTETQGSIVSPATRNGLCALRPTFGRVSRYGGMVLSWSQDKVGPMCRTIEDCALVFNAIHGVDEKDPSTVTAPFQFDRRIDLARVRIGYDENDERARPMVEKLREMGAKLVVMKPRPATNAAGAGGFGVESAAAFEMYATTANTPESTARALGRGRGGAARGGDPAEAGRGADPARGGGEAGRGTAEPGREGGTGRGGGGGGGGGRTTTALEYMQAQRRRLVLMQRMAEVMADVDMYVTSSGDVGLTNLTGHPAVVVQTGFGVPQQGGGRGGGRGGAAGDAGAAGRGDAGRGADPGRGGRGQQEPPTPNREQPLVTTLIGALFADDKVLSVAHAYQTATDWHTRRPPIK